MIATASASISLRRALCGAFLAVALLSCAMVGLAGAAEEKVVYKHESLKEYEAQLSAGLIQEARFNRKVRSLHLTLKDGTHALVKYVIHGEPALAAQLKAKGVPVTVVKPKGAKPVHHKLRYIVGGILVVVVLVVGAVLLIDRRRKLAAD